MPTVGMSVLRVLLMGIVSHARGTIPGKTVRVAAVMRADDDV